MIMSKTAFYQSAGLSPPALALSVDLQYLYAYSF